MKRLLFFLIFTALYISSYAQTLIMNEVSNGPSGNMEYVEFVVIDSNITYNCAGMANAPCIDIRGWIFDDNSGYHGAGGVASGCIRFSNNAFWSCIPVGTMILIYNNLDPNSSLPPDDVSMSDGNCRIVAPVSNTTLFESNATTPGAAACSYPAVGWTAGGNWNNTLFANTGDCARIVNLAGCEVFSVCWGTNNLFNLIYFAGSAQDRVYSFLNTLNNNPSNNANWNNGCADPVACGSNVQTPGAPNNAANAAWINSFNNGCAPIPPIAAVGSSTNGGCAPCAASASVSASGSIPPYTYTWSPSPGSGQGTANAGGLCTGTYSCFVESSIGCLDTIVVNVSSGGAFTATITPTPITCNGLTNGSATVAVTGGATPYSYTWTPAPGGGQGTATVSGLSAQIYSVNVRDAGGCSITVTTTITQPSVLTATINSGTILCNGGTTNATVTAAGGAGAYTYTWNPVGGNASISNNISAGSYTTIIKDANNCTITAVATITQSPVLIANISSGSILCNSGTTNATVTPVGGNPGYTYTWSPSGGNAAISSGLIAGTYTALVKDANNCTVTAVTNITQPSALTVPVSSSSVLCNGGATGSATVTAGGGTPGYSFTWSPSGGNSTTANNLTAGTYTTLVADANNCTVTAVTNIIQPATAVTAAIASSSLLCFGGTGSSTVTTVGGTPGYSYTWSPSGGNSATASNLTVGSYTALVSDANNCTVTAVTTIIQPAAPISILLNSTNASCGLTNGSATVNPSGGTSGYSYTWSPSGGNSSVASGLGSGTYSVLVSDVNNCTISGTVFIGQPSVIIPTISVNAVTCFGGSNGASSVLVSGGVGPFIYNWSPAPGAGQGTSLVSGLTSQNYTVNITDALGCFTTAVAVINQPSALTANLTSTNITCNGLLNGSAQVLAAGGTGAYSYSWTPAVGTTSLVSGIGAGNYTVLINDANNCTITSTISITEPSALSTTLNITDITCNGLSNGSATLTTSGGSPTFVYTWLPAGGSSSVVTNLSSGTHTVIVNDINTCSVTQTFVVNEPTPIVLINSQTNVTCFGASNGTGSVQVNGGIAPYTFSWANPVSSSSSISNLSPGSYTCIVIDNNNCTATTAINVTEPTQVIASTSNHTICLGSTATVTSTAIGGVGPYTFNWNGGTEIGQTINVSPSQDTTYTLIVTDVFGCNSPSVNSNITVLLQPSVTVSNNDSICVGSSITLQATVSGTVVGNINYLWSPGSFTTSSINVSPASTTVYNLSVALNGICPANTIKQVTVAVVPNPVVGVVNPSAEGCAPLCVNFKDNSSTALGTLTSWGWNFTNGASSIDKDPKICFNEAGTYTGEHSVVNSFGCISTVTFGVISIFPKPIADFNHAPLKPIINIDQEVVFTDASWGANIVSWNWFFMNTAQYTSIMQNPTFNYTEAGTYVVALIVKSDKGCTDTLLRPLVVGEDYGLYVPNVFTPNDDGLNDGFQPKGFGIVKYELYVFDRWGEKLFYTNKFEEAWDGRKQIKNDINYSICKDDVYTWLINVTDVFGKAHELTGHVTLLR